MKDIINKYKKEESNVCLYTNNNMNSFDYGKIWLSNDRQVAIKKNNFDGIDDGIYAVCIDDVCRIEIDESYNRRIRLLNPNQELYKTKNWVQENKKLRDLITNEIVDSVYM